MVEAAAVSDRARDIVDRAGGLAQEVVGAMRRDAPTSRFPALRILALFAVAVLVAAGVFVIGSNRGAPPVVPVQPE